MYIITINYVTDRLLGLSVFLLSTILIIINEIKKLFILYKFLI